MPGLLSPPRLQTAARWLWGLLLLTLPVTTFRYIPGFLGRSLVQPLAFYPLALLFPILLLIFLRERSLSLPSNIKPLLAFLFFALAVSLIGFLNAPLPLREATFDDRLLRGWVSLLIGLVFFFIAFWMNRSKEDLQWSLKWIYVGLGLTIAWSLVQALAVNTSVIPRGLINDIQLIFSTRPIPARRIIGFAYEPAWLADQIVIFYLPWLFAALLSRRSLTGRKWLEPLLFILSLVVLVFTYSRGGLLSAIGCMAIVFLLVGRNSLVSAWNWLLAPFKKNSKEIRRGFALVARIGLLAALAVAAFTTVNFLSRYEYFSSLWDLSADERPIDYVLDISAGPRLAYALAGYKIYEGAPLTGVGVGASGLQLLQNYPEWSYPIPEIARQLSPDSTLIPNTKSLYVRLLAETGLPGFWFFIVFLLSFLATIRRLYLSNDTALRFVAIAGLFAWLGIILRNLTQDSFTIPIMWVILGIIAGLDPFRLKEIRLKRKL